MNNPPKASQIIKEWRNNPLKFVNDNFKITPDKWQQDVLKILPDSKKSRIALKACKGPGKTALLAWVAWWFLGCWGDKGSHPKGAGTSITGDNLKDNLWPELAKWQGRSTYLSAAFEWKTERVFSKDHPSTWFFSARSWAKSADSNKQADTLAGLHADYVLFILDESGGIPDSVMAAADAGLSTNPKFGKIIQAGNPTNLEGPLYRACTAERDIWEVFTITGDPDSPNRSPRIDKKWAMEQIKRYGRENPWVLVNVFGEFPPSSMNTLLSPDEVEKAMNRGYQDHEFNFQQKRVGVDVARFGSDRTVLFPRQGLMSYRPVEMRNARTTDITARILLAKEKWGSELEIIDDTGHWGHGVVDNLVSAGFDPVAIQFHSSSVDPRYKNKRAEGWLKMADWVKKGGALPKIPELIQELTSPTYTFSNGKFQLEDKDQIKARIGKSPDLADALALTFMVPELPTKTHYLTGEIIPNEKGHIKDWDPLHERVAV